MKKLVYSLALVVMGLASCTSWDDAITENYGDGPTISVDVQAVAPTDSAFTFTLTPAAGTTYYAFVIDANDEAEELDNYTLLKGGYGNTVLNTSNNATFTATVKTAAPNTTYQIYAVASNDKGIAGKVVVASIKTTDSYKPSPASFKADAANKTVAVSFKEAVARGEGKVTAKYYKEWDITNPVDIAEEEISVAIANNVVTVATPTAPAGAYVTVSYEAGAFVDAVGNPCNALNSELDMTTGKFKNINFHVPTAAFAVTDANITSPKDGELVADWKTFEGVLTFEENIYRNDAKVEDGDVSVTYKGNKKNAVYKLSADEWNVDGNKLIFTLPEAANAGDIITVSLVEGAITDVLGNPNAAFTSKTSWKYFAMTADMAVGTFDINYVSYWSEDGSAESLGKITITANEGKENGLFISGLFIEGSKIEGSYDLNAGKIYIPDGQVLGEYKNSKGIVYNIVFATADGTAAAAFTVNPDGSMTADGMWGLYAYDEAFENEVGWLEVAKTSVLVPASGDEPAASRAAKKSTSKKVSLRKSARSLKKLANK